MNIEEKDFLFVKKVIFESIGLQSENFIPEVESQAYRAATFSMNEYSVKFRVAKITPTKKGQFVTLWKRIGKGPIIPFDLTDPIDFFMILIRDGSESGLFVFPKSILLEKKIVSKSGKGGKLAMRIYPSWVTADSKQARATQIWQLSYFFKIESGQILKKVELDRLFS